VQPENDGVIPAGISHYLEGAGHTEVSCEGQGGNVQTLLLRWRFLALLVALLLLLVLCPVLQGAFDTRLVFHVLLSLVFVAAAAAVFPDASVRPPALLLAIPTLLGAWTGYVLPGLPEPPVAVAFHLLATLFLGFTVATILRAVYGQGRVSADSICAALCGYLLVGVAFGHLYTLAEAVAPGSFQVRADLAIQLHDPGRRQFLLTYFSLVTLTTVGYGDITPGSDPARGLAAVEAVLGQFYIAVLIAELIGKRVAQTLSGPRP
jgi:hypothetical protein